MTSTNVSQDCVCVRCVGACKRRPGWFAPGQAEAVAARLGKTVAEMLGRELVIDYWVGRKDTFLLMPNVEGNTARVLGAWPPQGRCVFLDAHDRCAIHDIKPYECRAVKACDDADPRNHHRETAMLWRPVKHQREMRRVVDTWNEERV